MFTNFLLQNRSKPMVRILEKYGTDNKSNPDLANSHPNPTEENRFFFLKKKTSKTKSNPVLQQKNWNPDPNYSVHRKFPIKLLKKS